MHTPYSIPRVTPLVLVGACLCLIVQSCGDTESVNAKTSGTNASSSEEQPSIGALFFSAIKDGDTALMKEMLAENPNLVSMERPDDFKGYEQWPIELACKEKNLEMMKLLVQTGASIKEAEQTRGSLLCVAMLGFSMEPEKETLPLVQFLVENGAQVNLEGGSQFRPLDMATGQSSVVTKFLLDNGADILHASPSGDTCVHHLAYGGALEDKVEIARLLVDRGAPLNLKSSGNTYKTEAHQMVNTPLAILTEKLTKTKSAQSRRIYEQVISILKAAGATM